MLESRSSRALVSNSERHEPRKVGHRESPMACRGALGRALGQKRTVFAVSMQATFNRMYTT